MKYNFFISFLSVFSLVIFSASESFSSEESFDQKVFADVSSDNFSEGFCLGLENKLENKFLLNEEGVLIEEGLFDSFTKEDVQLFLNTLSEKYTLIMNAANDLSLEKTKAEGFCLGLENKLEDKFLLNEEGLLIEEGLFDSFTKEDVQLLFNKLSQKYTSIIDDKDESNIEKTKNAPDLLDNNTNLEDLKKDNLKLESQILNLQKSIFRIQVGLVVGAVAGIGYGVYKYYKKSDNK